MISCVLRPLSTYLCCYRAMPVDRVDTLNTHQRVWNFLVMTRWLAINFYNQTPAPPVSRGLLFFVVVVVDVVV